MNGDSVPGNTVVFLETSITQPQSDSLKIKSIMEYFFLRKVRAFMPDNRRSHQRMQK